MTQFTSPSAFRVKIQSQTEQLQLVRSFISKAAQQFGFDEESVHRIALAVDEACTNIIKHAYEFAPDNDIDIRIITNDHKFEVIITHHGKSFDPESVRVPDMREYLSSYRKGGLGMHIMRSMMDKVEYKQLSDTVTEIHLIKFLRNKVNS